MAGPSLSSFIDIFTTPSAVFSRIKAKEIHSWPAFFLILFCALAFYGWYFFTADMYQFMETSIRLSGQEVNPADIEQILANETLVRSASLLGTAISFFVGYLIIALFFFLAATLIAEEKLKYGQFFSLICWASLPTLLSLLSMSLTFFLANDFVWVAQLDKTSLASILNLPLESSYFDVASITSVALVWSYVLYALGFAHITRCSLLTASLVTLVPASLQLGLTYLF